MSLQKPRTDNQPCPFCGCGTIGEIDCQVDTGQGYKWGSVVCPECEARGPSVRTHYQHDGPWVFDALAAWNHRGKING